MKTSNHPPSNWVQEHTKSYIESNGEDGHIWNEVPTLLLTTTGRRTGRLITTPLIYGKDGSRYFIVASRGGSHDHPNWYLNLNVHPTVEVQVLASKFQAEARTARNDEKWHLWSIMARIWPAYDDYQSRTTRLIPVVILEPTTTSV
jgi:deazaflavin-dependent oxidoreductase (nitroreductase family)